MKQTRKLNIALFIATIFAFQSQSCKKQDDFLNAKPLAALAAITSLEDCQLLLNSEEVFNYRSSPYLGEASTDDYYVPQNRFVIASSTAQNTYIWAKTIYPAGSNDFNWSGTYSQVYYANTVLDALKRLSINQNEKQQADRIRGIALFYRSYAFFNLLQIFSLPYDSATSASTPGIPLRLNSDLNVPVQRGSEKDGYTQLINDLTTAVDLLPITSSTPSQPSKVAADAMLARVYLSLSKYDSALKYSNAALGLKNVLFDFNTIIPGPAYYYLADPSQYPLPELIYLSTFLQGGLDGSTRNAIVDSNLYKLYDPINDIRSTAFFSTGSGQLSFVGSYEFIIGYRFDGLATDEIYLIRAECNARSGNIDLAMNDINALLLNRYKTGTLIPKTATNTSDALDQVLAERRKELTNRGLRWTDLRRLNKDPRYAVTLTRVINGTTYTLPPNDPRYALPIPDNEIQLSKIQQNNR